MDNDTQDISKSLAFIIEHMATKDDVREIINEMVPPIVQKIVHEELRPIESKVSGIDKRLDIEADHRNNMKIPGRVSELEKKVFGKSREPEILTL